MMMKLQFLSMEYGGFVESYRELFLVDQMCVGILSIMSSDTYNRDVTIPISLSMIIPLLRPQCDIYCDTKKKKRKMSLEMPLITKLVCMALCSHIKYVFTESASAFPLS